MNAFNSSNYCKDAGKAVINYRSYSEGIIRYRYPSQNWQEINGDSYEIINNTGSEQQIPRYRVFLTAKVIGRYPPDLKKPAIFNDGDIVSLRSSNPFYGIIKNSVVFNIDGRKRVNFKSINRTASTGSAQYENTTCYIQDSVSTIQSNESAYKKGFLYDYNSTNTYAGITDVTISHVSEEVNDAFPPLVCSPKNSNCIFKVFNCEGKVTEIVRPECPEVEQIEPELGEEKSITVSPIPKNHYIEVNNFAYSISSGTSKSASKISIPPHCLNIYKVDGTFFNPVAKSNNDEHPLKLIAQVCSAKCSPPPQVNVICLPPDKCPPGTCEVQCGNHVCCYNSDGISVFSFPK